MGLSEDGLLSGTAFSPPGAPQVSSFGCRRSRYTESGAPRGPETLHKSPESLRIRDDAPRRRGNAPRCDYATLVASVIIIWLTVSCTALSTASSRVLSDVTR